MLLIRRFEEQVEERFRAGELPGFLHVAIGQEAVAVGVCGALEEGDVIASTHRAHGHTLAKGTHPNELMAELYGKVEGCSHGYGGSMHLYDIERGSLGANAVVGGGLPAITGAGLAFKMRGEPRVAVAFFGDGATNIGTFHEALGLAQLWRTQSIFVCENNHYAESTPAEQQLPIRDLAERAKAFGMTAMTVDGQDVEAVYAIVRKAPRPRGGQWSRLRPRRDVPPDRPLRRRPAGLPAEGRGARAAPEPGSGREAPREARGLRRGLGGARPRSYGASSRARSNSPRTAPTPSPRTPSRTSMPETTYREALRHAMSEAMRRDEDVFIRRRGHRRDGRLDGRDAGDARRVRARPGPQHADRRDGDRGGGDRRGHTGHASDRRDMYQDFTTLAMEQLRTRPRSTAMSGGQLSVPLTVWTQGGAGWSPGAQHAQQLEGWFVHVPDSRSSSHRRRTTRRDSCGARSTTTTPSSSSTGSST